MALSFQNCIAAIEGFAGKKTEFVRTPKFNVTNSGFKLLRDHSTIKFPRIVIYEIMLLIYFVCGAVIGIYNYEFTFLAFHVLLSIRYAMLIKISITEYFSSSFSSIN